ncbi:hypothetical protein JCM11251_005412 [Rhodosporidiobolus azoricus]
MSFWEEIEDVPRTMLGACEIAVSKGDAGEKGLVDRVEMLGENITSLRHVTTANVLHHDSLDRLSQVSLPIDFRQYSRSDSNEAFKLYNRVVYTYPSDPASALHDLTFPYSAFLSEAALLDNLRDKAAFLAEHVPSTSSVTPARIFEILDPEENLDIDYTLLDIELRAAMARLVKAKTGQVVGRTFGREVPAGSDGRGGMSDAVEAEAEKESVDSDPFMGHEGRFSGGGVVTGLVEEDGAVQGREGARRAREADFNSATAQKR